MEAEKDARLGRRAAHLLWDRLPGRWVVRVAERNGGAVPFWSRAITDYTGREPAALEGSLLTSGWQVFSLRSGPPGP